MGNLIFFINRHNGDMHLQSSGGTGCKEPTWQCRRPKRLGFDPCVGKIPWRRTWQPTPVLSGFSYLENPMDRGAWPATVHGVSKRWT